MCECVFLSSPRGKRIEHPLILLCYTLRYTRIALALTQSSGRLRSTQADCQTSASGVRSLLCSRYGGLSSCNEGLSNLLLTTSILSLSTATTDSQAARDVRAIRFQFSQLCWRSWIQAVMKSGHVYKARGWIRTDGRF